MPMNKNYKHIIYEAEDGVANITINKPPLNILDVSTIKEITSALKIANTSKNVFAVIVTGAGNRAFSAGVDIKAHLPDKVEKTLHEFHEMFHVLTHIQKPTIAKIRGLALGGGCELAIACDMVVASDESQLGQPEIKVGAIATIAAALLSKLIPRKKALELLFTGDTLNASEAQEVGLINKVVSRDKLDEAVDELVGKLRDKSPIVLQFVRQAIYQGVDSNFETALNGVTEVYLNKLIKTKDAVEGLEAFLEKRRPKWEGK